MSEGIVLMDIVLVCIVLAGIVLAGTVMAGYRSDVLYSEQLCVLYIVLVACVSVLISGLFDVPNIVLFVRPFFEPIVIVYYRLFLEIFDQVFLPTGQQILLPSVRQILLPTLQSPEQRFIKMLNP